MKDLSIILAPVSQDSPCGGNLYEDQGFEVQFAKLVDAGLGIAVESFVEGEDTISSASSTQSAWSELQDQLIDLFRQTKHLDMLYLLALSNGHLNGIRGLIDGLDYTNSLLERNWDSIHPEDSEGDYEFRQESLKKFDSSRFADSLDSLVIADGKQLGKYTLGAWLISKKDDTEGQKAIEQAAAETLRDKPAFYDDLASHLNEIQESIERLQTNIKDRFVNFRLQFNILKAKIGDIAQLIANFSDIPIEGIAAGSNHTLGTSGNQASNGNFDQINSREDVIRILSKVILFYTKNEPTSPVPVMLERAQRVATMNFKEIVKEFNLSGTPSIQEVLGWQPDEI